MKKNSILFLMAVLPLVLFSCAKETVIDIEEQEAFNPNPDPWTVLPMAELPVVNGDLTITAKTGEDTKSQFTFDGSSVGISWTAGDVFKMYGMDGTTYCGTTTYTADASGPVVNFSGGASIASATSFYSIYPSSAVTDYSFYSGDPIFGVDIPVAQDAVANNIAEGVNLSFALSAAQEEDLHFKNVVAYIKFRLSGSVVDQIKSVTFRGTGILAGGVIIESNAFGEPEIVDGLYFAPDTRTTSVTLSGNFAADTDYYIAVAPGLQEGFSMVFANSDGSQTITKFSSKQLTLNRSRITDFGTISLGDSFDSADSIAELYIEHTTAKYATIAVIPDGYTKAEMDQYVLNAKSGIDALFNTEPYKTYRNYFNVWILKVASNESGARIADGTPEEQTRDCYFQSSWSNSSYSDMHANPVRVFSFVLDNCPDVADGSHDIANVPVLLIINDDRYGGIAWNYDNGLTYCMVPTTTGTLGWGYPANEASSVNALPTDPEGIHTVTDGEKLELGLNYSGTWRNTLVHEFGGHSIGKLGDEYWYNTSKDAVESIPGHSWGVPMSLNISAKSSAALVPWAELFDSGIQAQIAAKPAGVKEKYNRIGVFQGGDVSMFYRWRSEKISCMIDNRFYFSTWQRFIIVNRIMTLAGLSAITLSDFLDNDVPTDPLRDGGSPVMLPEGVSNRVPPRMMPMLPPPRYVNEVPVF